MGFLKPSTPSLTAAAPATVTSSEPEVVAEVVRTDAAADYDQKASRRRGLLSTILTDQHHHSSTPLAQSARKNGNTTLG